MHIAIRDIRTEIVALQYNMKPQDVLILLKIIALDDEQWQQTPLAQALKMSQSEVSQSVARSKYSGLLDIKGKRVMRKPFMDFLEHGLALVFPAKPGALVRGVPTAHSAVPLKNEISSDENFVWPFAHGTLRGQGIAPLYATVPQAAMEDEHLHALLALCDALRVGKTREKNLAIKELKKRLC